jgi:N-acetylglucosamine kinase-like BadF-type ATPase
MLLWTSVAEKGDTFAAELFQNAGHILGQHLTTIARHFDDEMFTNEVPVILIGSVFKSWAFLRGGFQKSLNDYNAKKVNEKGKCIRVVTFYQLECSSAIG